MDLPSHHVLTLTCPDRPGVVHAVCSGVLDIGGNIVENQQFTDPETDTFCMRMLVATPSDDPSQLHWAVADRLDDPNAAVSVRPDHDRPNVLIMVSKFDHCLVDLLYRWRNGLLSVNIPLIVSNHPDCHPVAERYDIPFLHLPVSKDTKPEQEAQIQELVRSHDIDLVVLARYMQILSDDLCEFLRGRAINIHHSFLPGFKGAKPYHQAFERGVKLIGATAHYVTSDLDEGPIIQQSVQPVDHSYSPDDLVAVGRDTETSALANAARLHMEHRVFLDGNKTVIFR